MENEPARRLPAAAEPFTCALPAAEFEARVRAWSARFDPAVRTRARIQGGVRLILQADNEQVRRLEDLIEAERECCPWIDWHLRREAGRVVVDITARPPGDELLAAWFGPIDPSPPSSAR